MFARLAERGARAVRFALVLGWGVIIASLFWDPYTSALTAHDAASSPFRLDRHADDEAAHERYACPRRSASGGVDWVGTPEGECDRRCTSVQGRCLVEQAYPVGARLFWTILFPLVPMFLLIFGHEAWRRICPLSALMQIPRRLGIQRTRKVIHPQTGRVERKLVLVSPDSFLGRHFWYVQGALLFLGVTLRILFINSDRVALGVFFLSVIAIAMTVGYLFGGKTWCNYICPVSAVQKVYTEPRGLFESEAHAGKLRLTQSTCRTIAPDGKEQSTCVGCKSPCPDVDLERQYWAGLMEPGRRAFYYAYFGLVWGFYGYYAVYAGNAGYYFSGAWTHEEGVASELGAPGVFLAGRALPWPPKWLAAPLTILLAMLVAVLAGQALEKAYGAFRGWRGQPLTNEALRHRSLVLCTFLTFNSFYLFGGRPNVNLLPTVPRVGFDIFIVSVGAIWLTRTWPRSSSAYERESVTEALRRQLDKLGGLLKRALGDRSVAQLETDEVFVLAQTLPLVSTGARLDAYRATLRECLVAGHADSATGLAILESLREQMEVSQEEHAEILAELGIEESALLGSEEARSLENRLRLDGFRESLERVLVSAADRGMPVKKALADETIVAEIRALQRTYSVSAAEQDAVVDELTGRSGRLVERVERGLAELLWLHMNRASLIEADDTPAQRAMLAVMTRRRARLVERTLHLLSGLGDDPAHQQLARRLSALASTEVKRMVRERVRSLQLAASINEGLMTVVNAAMEHGQSVPRPDSVELCARAVREWGPIERSVALFALAHLDRERAGALAEEALTSPNELLRETARVVHAAVRRSQREVVAPPALARLFMLLDSQLEGALSLESLAALAQIGELRAYAPTQLIWSAGVPSDHFLALVSGSAHAELDDTGERVGSIAAGEFVGELGVILGRPRSLAVRAGDQGAQVLVFGASAFKSLLRNDRLAAAGFLTLVSTRLAATLERVAHA